MNFRPIADGAGKFLPWVKTTCRRSGIYVIRCTTEFCPLLANRILYVGESHTDNLSKTLKRHFFSWRDAPERTHNVYKKSHVEIAIRLLPASRAVGAQNRLILRLNPRDNGQLPLATEGEKPF